MKLAWWTGEARVGNHRRSGKTKGDWRWLQRIFVGRRQIPELGTRDCLEFEAAEKEHDIHEKK